MLHTVEACSAPYFELWHLEEDESQEKTLFRKHLMRDETGGGQTLAGLF